MLLLVEAQEMAFLKLKMCTAHLNASRSAFLPKEVKITKQDKIVSERQGT